VKPFMDVHTMLEERLLQCCVHVGTETDDGTQQCASFCAVQAWLQLGRMKLGTRAGRQAVIPVAQVQGAPILEEVRS
jgi:hypothetical protein